MSPVKAPAENFRFASLRKPGNGTTVRLQQLMEQQQRIEIGQRIKELREASPQTNRSISEHVGVGERAVANWIAGKTGIEYDNAKRVAELFGVDVQWLWEGEKRPAPDVLGALDGQPDIPAKLEEISAQLDAQAKLLQELKGQIAVLGTGRRRGAG